MIFSAPDVGEISLCSYDSMITQLCEQLHSMIIPPYQTNGNRTRKCHFLDEVGMRKTFNSLIDKNLGHPLIQRSQLSSFIIIILSSQARTTAGSGLQSYPSLNAPNYHFRTSNERFGYACLATAWLQWAPDRGTRVHLRGVASLLFSRRPSKANLLT